VRRDRRSSIARWRATGPSSGSTPSSSKCAARGASSRSRR
jgi:hypothetical protein